MLERLTLLFRFVCILLAGLILFQVARLVARRNAYAQIGVGSRMAVSTKTDSATNKPGATKVQVPPEIAARVEKIKESQVLGMVVRPPPMALLGIAGADVILRGPNGQMGIIRVGEELGGVKLLQVGLNRILVLHEGKTNELILFEGIGSETLLGKEKSK
jgi:hypothetical protein